MVEITAKNGTGGGLQGDGPAYYDVLRIEVKRIDDPRAATEALASWLCMKLMTKNPAKTFANEKEIVDSMMFETSYRLAWTTIFYLYLSDSYWGSRRTDVKQPPPSNAL